MITNLTLNLCGLNLKFFVANCKNIDGILSKINIKKITAQNYDFGIILNSSIYHEDLQSIKCPLYSPIEILNYYILEVNYKSNSNELCKNKFKFIFIDLNKIFNTITTYTDFVAWFIDATNNLDDYTNNFIVINEIYEESDYENFDEINYFSQNFLKILFISVSKNTYILTTDNDYFANITVNNNHSYQNSDKLNLILCGNIGDIVKKPKFLDNYDEISDDFIVNETSNFSGFVEIVKNNLTSYFMYKSLNNKEISFNTISSILRIIESSCIGNVINNSLKQSLLAYKIFIEDYDIINIYKSYKPKNNLHKSIMRDRLIDNIVPKINYFLSNR
ncbi:hypothetical protein QLL95_gp0775 [Cotonvirus japonicus]|uniref:Uncharacterized protein n=1 Tax=Cotonvirus japonicus TaxID=2811091 RepID=A0ABM7NT49_9VIRU|nr:hypothetical protein QLL95_gp0775 [Cotonvirus japonicus]BCS83348.1 hypothetical protein [Cotonvirus japonicus]